ncbi:MAG TPA: OsmC family protein [Candidatus Dormibacteraeota bacterium]|nr:OsmC family protein [Candidatus Dormibacteraeota bacterium]
MKRTGSAVWTGGLKEGAGKLSTQSGTLRETPYSFSARFESGAGTNPEELIAAAHAGCFAMALSAQLGGANITPAKIEATAEVSLEKLDAGWTITASHLRVSLHAPGADRAACEKAAGEAKVNCPVSRLLKANVTMDLTVAV